MQDNQVDENTRQYDLIDTIYVQSHGYGSSGNVHRSIVHASSDVHVGHIVMVPKGSTYVTSVVVTVVRRQCPADPTLAEAVPTPYALTETQIELARWIAQHYITTVEHALSVFVSRTMFPAPSTLWSTTQAGITCDLGALSVDERGVLFHLRRAGTHTTDELLATLTVTVARLKQLLYRLSERGYVQRSLHFPVPPQRKKKHPVTVQYDAVAAHREETWLTRSAKRRALLVPFAEQAPNALVIADNGGYTALKPFIERGILVPNQSSDQAPSGTRPVTLTATQEAIVAQILPCVQRQSYEPFLLHGVTGSGKTEVYFAVIDACLAAGRQVLVLVPEIALTTQIAGRFERRFPNNVCVVHGDISLAERHHGWQRAQDGTVQIILGPRSALSVPIPRLGLVIIDEEHDSSYKSDRAPYVNARDTAMIYARFAHVPVILGSATPSVELMHAIHNGAVRYLQLSERVGTQGVAHQRPPIRIVDMRGTMCVDAHGLISDVLHERIVATLAESAHVMLLLNRRGATGSRICRNCGTVAMCPRCSTPLVGHGTAANSHAVCHTCGFRRHQENHCHACFHREFLDIGSGTQRVVHVLQMLFPGIPILQWDRDTTSTAKAHALMLAEIQQHPAAIIVGTQMIAKGLDLERIRLVGVVNADLALHLPDFRATERTYQLLTQVAGRAGRRAGDASVVFQSYTPENYAIQCAARYDDTEFYTRELAFREYMQYPPFQRLAKLVWVNRTEAVCASQAQTESLTIAAMLAEHHPDVRTIGPTPAFFHKVRDRYHWQLLVVGPNLRTALNRTKSLHHAIIDMDPTTTL
ncbi:MAG: hypothetical protein RLY87_1496 [Chloroflexota bacterium]